MMFYMESLNFVPTAVRRLIGVNPQQLRAAVYIKSYSKPKSKQSKYYTNKPSARRGLEVKKCLKLE